MSAHKQLHEELARDAESKASRARDEATRGFWTDRAAVHRVLGEHYDSFDPAKKRAMDLAGEDDLRYRRTGTTEPLKSCTCTEDACYCTATRRQDSADLGFAQRERERARRDALLAERETRNAARSGVAAMPALRAPSARAAIEATQRGGGAARQEMIRARASACKTTK